MQQSNTPECSNILRGLTKKVPNCEIRRALVWVKARQWIGQPTSLAQSGFEVNKSPFHHFECIGPVSGKLVSF
jgi:hypothetical protein